MNDLIKTPITSVTKIDLGCGKNKREGYFGVDQFAMPGVDLMLDLGKDPWPFSDDQIEDVHCSHFFEHLDVPGRIHFMNELYRVMKVDGKAVVTCPYGFSGRAYGDLSHCWPPVVEMSFFYFDRTWRMQNAPHLDIDYNPKGLSCHFNSGYGYSMHPLLHTRNREFQELVINFCKEAAQDISATMTKLAWMPA